MFCQADLGGTDEVQFKISSFTGAGEEGLEGEPLRTTRPINVFLRHPEINDIPTPILA